MFCGWEICAKTLKYNYQTPTYILLSYNLISRYIARFTLHKKALLTNKIATQKKLKIKQKSKVLIIGLDFKPIKVSIQNSIVQSRSKEVQINKLNKFKKPKYNKIQVQIIIIKLNYKV